LGEGEVELGAAFVAGCDAAVFVEPGVGAFDRPAVGDLGVADTALAGPVAFGDVRFDAALTQRGADVFGVVAAVGQKLVGSFAPAAAQGRDRIDDRERVAAVVVVGWAQANGQWGAVAVAG
jgi:hypothetical protein